MIVLLRTSLDLNMLLNSSLHPIWQSQRNFVLNAIQRSMQKNLNQPCAETYDRCSRERLYCASGYGLIQCVKALMSFEDEVCSTRFRF